MAKNIFNSPHKSCATRLLKMLPDEDLQSLVSTASLSRIDVYKKKEAINAILVSCPDLDKFFSFRKLTSKVLLNFAVQEKLVIDGQATRQKLVSLLTSKWEQENKVASTSSSSSNIVSRATTAPAVISTTQIHNITVQVVKIKSTDLGRDFCEWFYSMINKVLLPQLQGDTLRPDIFCSNAEVEVFLIDGITTSSHKAKGSEQAYTIINGMLKELQFLFTPNLDGGLQTVRNQYGMITVMCCGTIHKHDAFIGIFEQEFGLVPNPADKSWKIAGMKVNLKQGHTYGVPSLPPIEAFEI